MSGESMIFFSHPDPVILPFQTWLLALYLKIKMAATTSKDTSIG